MLLVVCVLARVFLDGHMRISQALHGVSVSVCLRARVTPCVSVRVCLRACVRTCVRACVRACVGGGSCLRVYSFNRN